MELTYGGLRSCMPATGLDQFQAARLASIKIAHLNRRALFRRACDNCSEAKVAPVCRHYGFGPYQHYGAASLTGYRKGAIPVCQADTHGIDQGLPR